VNEASRYGSTVWKECNLYIFSYGTLKSGWGKKAPAITLSQLRTLIEAILPLKKQTFETLLEQIAWIQARNHRAYLSHRKRRIRMLTSGNQVSL
jgi:hypothetical protein